MDDGSHPPPLPAASISWPTARLFLVLLGIALVATSIYVFLVEPRLNRHKMSVEEQMALNQLSTPFLFAGVRQPPTKSVGEANLADDAEVIGVSVAGHRRAYALHAFDNPSSHVVNDLLGNVPVTVTYCDISHCARVFTGEHGTEPLQVSLGGFIHGDMLLYKQQVYYNQRTLRALAPNLPPFPYPELPFERVSWGAWREAHPDTDVYVGLPRPPRPEGQEGQPPPPSDLLPKRRL